MRRNIVGQLSVAKDYFPFPGGRFRKNGKGSGEEFRDDFLVPRMQEAINQKGCLVVNLDGVMGYPSSFLEEAFGGLIRVSGFTKPQVDSHLIIEVTEPHLGIYADLAADYLADAERHRLSRRAVA